MGPNDRPFITYEPGHIIRNMALRYMTDGDRSRQCMCRRQAVRA